MACIYFPFLFFISSFRVTGYVVNQKFSLNQNDGCNIITFVMNVMASAVGGLKEQGFFGEMTMARFYAKVWVPFMEPKKRILLLALAAYIAMC